VIQQSGDDAASVQLFAWVAQNYPAHPWSNVGRLALAIRAFNTNDFVGAQKLTEEITNKLQENSKMAWIREMYWSAVYLRGCCLEAQGDPTEGGTLKQMALGKYPDLYVRRQLHSP
jgi:hypothetical protein